MSGDQGTLNTWFDGPVGWLEIHNPTRRNALDLQMLEAFPGALKSLMDGGARSVVLTGSGTKAFSSGYDLAALRTGAGEDWVEDSGHPLTQALDVLQALDAPLLLAANGPVIGGGVLLLLAADIALASGNAWLSIPAARVGVVYPLAGLEDLFSTLGRGRAMDLLLTARRLPATEAERWGLYQRLTGEGELRKATQALAAEIAALAPLSHAGHRAFAVGRNHGRRAQIESHLAHARQAHASADHVEGLNAMKERRKPRFCGS